MQTRFAPYLLAILLTAPAARAEEGKTIYLKQPVIGCENKADLRDFPHELPKAITLSEMPLPYREGRCVKLAAGRLTITKVQGTYACLYRAPHSCLWVRSEDVGAPIVGDFDMPGRGGHASPPQRVRPEFTPQR